MQDKASFGCGSRVLHPERFTIWSLFLGIHLRDVHGLVRNGFQCTHRERFGIRLKWLVWLPVECIGEGITQLHRRSRKQAFLGFSSRVPHPDPFTIQSLFLGILLRDIHGLIHSGCWCGCWNGKGSHAVTMHPLRLQKRKETGIIRSASRLNLKGQGVPSGRRFLKRGERHGFRRVFD